MCVSDVASQIRTNEATEKSVLLVEVFKDRDTEENI